MAAPTSDSSAAPAADVAMWLRAGMAASASRGSERGESMTLLLEEEQKRTAAAATQKFELENGDAAREAVRREFEAEQLAKTNRQLKGMVVRLRDELKESQRELAEARGGLHYSESTGAQARPQASEEDFRNRTTALINHLQEQAKLAEMREKQSVAHMQQQMHGLREQLASAHRLRDMQEARTWALQDWLEARSVGADVAARVIPALEEMEIASADWISTLETFSASELAEFVAELPAAADGGALTEAAAMAPVRDGALVVAPEATPLSLPAAAPVGSPRVARESGDSEPMPAAAAAAAATPSSGAPAVDTPAAPVRRVRQPSVWDGVPTPESRDAVRILAEMGEAAPLQRWRLSGVLGEDAPVFQPESDSRALPFASFRGASVVAWCQSPQSDSGDGLVIRTQFGEGDNLHWISAAGGVRDQLTFFDSASLGHVCMRPVIDGRTDADDGTNTAAGPGACCAYVLGSDRVVPDCEVESRPGIHGVHLFNISARQHVQLPPVVEADTSLELSAHAGSGSAQPATPRRDDAPSHVRKDCGLCWSRDGESLVWSSSAGASTGGLDLVHWHAASGTTRRLVCAGGSGSLLALGFAPCRKKLLLVKRIHSAVESQLYVLDLGDGALADGSFRPSPRLRPLFEKQLGADSISYGGVAGLGLGKTGGWAGASWGGVCTGSFAGVVYASDEGADSQRLRYCVVDTESCEAMHDGLLADHGGQSDIIGVACSEQSATVAYVRTVDHGRSTVLHLLDTSEISAAARTGVPLVPDPVPGPMESPTDTLVPSTVDVKTDQPEVVGVPGFGVFSSALQVSDTTADASSESAEDATDATESDDTSAGSEGLLMSGLRFSRDGLQLAVTAQTAQTVADVYVLTTRVDVHKVRTRLWSRWSASELGGTSAAQVVAARRAYYPSEDVWSTNADGSKPLQIPLLVYEPVGPAPASGGFPVVVWMPDDPLTSRGDETSSSISTSSPLASTQGCVLDAGIQLLVRESGAAVLVPHVRGSTGYGLRYAGLAKQHRREAAAKDVRSLLTWLGGGGGGGGGGAQYDLTRVALYGVGQGGFLAASVAAALCGLQQQQQQQQQPAIVRPRCVALEQPVTNLVTFLAETAPYLQPMLRHEFG